MCNRPYTGCPSRARETALSDDPPDDLPDDPPDDQLPDPRPGPRLDGLDLEQQVCFALSIAARGVVAAYRPLLEPLGLTHPQYLVMVALWQHGPQTVGRLGSRLLLDSGTVSPLLKRLEGMGHVQRSRSGSDERRVVVALTEQGARLRAEAVEIHEQVVDRLGLPSDELEHLQEVLERLIEVTVRSTTRSLTGVQP